MKELTFETGLVTYNLNGKCEVSFNPTDGSFVENLFNAFDALDKRQEAYKTELDKIKDGREIFEFARKLDAEMREIIDGAFSAPVCNAVFGGMNVYAIADGLPVWANLLLAVIDEIDAGISNMKELKEAMDIRISKYTKRYHR